MTVSVKDLQGATPTISEKLKEAGITNNEQLLAAAAAPAQRKALAGTCGCDPRVILELANRADLARIKGVSGVDSDQMCIRDRICAPPSSGNGRRPPPGSPACRDSGCCT